MSLVCLDCHPPDKHCVSFCVSHTRPVPFLSSFWCRRLRVKFCSRCRHFNLTTLVCATSCKIKGQLLNALNKPRRKLLLKAVLLLFLPQNPNQKPVILRKRRQRIKIEVNWELFYYRSLCLFQPRPLCPPRLFVDLLGDHFACYKLQEAHLFSYSFEIQSLILTCLLYF